MRRGIYLYTPDTPTLGWRVRGALFAIIPLLLTGLAWWSLVLSNAQLAQGRLQSKATEAVRVLESDIEVYADTLYGVRALFLVQPNLTRDEWDAFILSQNFADRYPASKNIVYAQKATSDEADDVRSSIDSQRRSGEPKTVMQKVDPDMAVITYVSNPDTISLLGLNMYYRDVYYNAMVRAQETTLPSASVVYESHAPGREGNTEFLMVLSLFDSLPPKDASEEENVANTRGYVTITTDTQSLLDNTFDLLSIPDEVTVTVSDAEGTPFYTRGEKQTRSGFEKHAYINVGGQIWDVSFMAPYNYQLTVREKTAPYIFLIGGIILSTLLIGVHLEHSGVRLRFTVSRSKRR